MMRQLAYRLMKNETCLRAMVTVPCFRHGCTLRKDGDTYLLQRDGKRIRLAARHLLYAPSTAEHFDTYFSQVQPTVIDSHAEVDYSTPRLQTLANGLEFELSSLPEEGSALDAYFRFYTPKPGETVFDIGAYCGVFTYELSRIVGPGGRVIAFEPDPLNVELLRRNVERHKLANVTVVQAAMSDHDGSQQFNSEGALGSALTSAIDRPSADQTMTVPTITLERACREYGPPAFVKIDAEGSEIEILSGAQEFLTAQTIQFVLDTNHIRYGKTTNGPVESLFAASGYAAESSEDHGGFMTTWAKPTH